MGSNNILESFKHAAEGIAEALKSERNLRIHFLIGGLVLVSSIFLNIPREDILWLIFAVFSVIGVELINTLVEGLMDLYSKDYNPMIKFIKDVSAGIVLWYTLFSIVVGFVVLGKALFGWKELTGKVFSIAVLLIFPLIMIWEAVRGNATRRKDKSDDSG